MKNFPPELAARTVELIEAQAFKVGIYFLIHEDVVVYIGQSGDVEHRLACHRDEGFLLFDRAFWLPVVAERLDRYEGALIRAMRPRFNKRAPVQDADDVAVRAELGFEPLKESHRLILEDQVKAAGGNVRWELSNLEPPRKRKS